MMKLRRVRGLVVTALLSTACAAHRPPAPAPATSTRGVVAGCEPSVVVDEKGATFGRWMAAFRKQVKRHWTLPYSAAGQQGEAVVTFRVARDGVLDQVALTKASPVAAHNEAVLRVFAAITRTAPLPRDYPDAHAEFAVHFCYNDVRP